MIQDIWVKFTSFLHQHGVGPNYELSGSGGIDWTRLQIQNNLHDVKISFSHLSSISFNFIHKDCNFTAHSLAASMLTEESFVLNPCNQLMFILDLFGSLQLLLMNFFGLCFARCKTGRLICSSSIFFKKTVCIVKDLMRMGQLVIKGCLVSASPSEP